MLEEKIEELKELAEKIQGEPLPEPEELSLESRRLDQYGRDRRWPSIWCVHFSEHDLASLAKTATERAVGDMKFGDRRDCDRMVERIRERIEELKQQKTLADQVKKRADQLLDRDRSIATTPIRCRSIDCVQLIGRQSRSAVERRMPELSRRASDAPLRINVLADDYWDLLAILR